MSRKLFKSTAVVSSMTLLSRISGLARDVVFARFFGAGLATDAFFIAFKIPNFMRRLFAEGAFSQAFVPVLSEYKAKREHEEVQALVGHVVGTLGAVLFLVTAAGVIAAPILVMIFAPGYIGDQARLGLTADMLRITFPYILFISLTALAGGVLNTYGKFAVPAVTPVLLNVCMIAAAIFISPRLEEPVVGMAWGVLIAGMVQLAYQFPYVARLKLLRWPRWGWRDPGVKKIVKLMIPAIFGSSVQQINLLFDILIASFLAVGSISWLYFADRLVEFPFGIFGVAIATVILPNLSSKHAADDPKQFTHTLDWAMRWTLLIGAPAAVGLAALSGPLIVTIFKYGAFSAHDLHMTQMALTAYTVGLLGFMYVKVLSPGYFARQDTKTPVKFAIVAIALKMVLTVGFVVSMMQRQYEAPHVGLALSTALSALFNSWLLLRGLRREGVYQPRPGWSLFIIRITIACAAMATLLYFFVSDLESWLQWGMFERVWHILIWIAAGGGLYFLVLLLLGVKVKQLIMHR